MEPQQPEENNVATVQPSLPAQPQQAVVTSSKPRKQFSLGRFLTLLFILLLLAGAGFLGYKYNQAATDLRQKASNLQSTQGQLSASNARIASLEQDQKIAIYNANAYDTLKKHTGCANSDPLIFNQTATTAKKADGSDKLYGIAQYFCISGTEVQKGPLRFIAAQSYDGGKTWEMMFGSSTVDPYSLPNFIYNTNPQLLDRVYNHPKHG